MHPGEDPFGSPTGDPFGAPPPVTYGAQTGGFPGAPGPPAPSFGAPPPRGDLNTLAVLSPIFGVIIPPAGVALGHLALPQINRSGERGRGAAIAGLVIGYTMCVLLIAGGVWWGITAGKSTTPTPTSQAFPTPTRSSRRSSRRWRRRPALPGRNSTWRRCRWARAWRSNCAPVRATTRWTFSKSTANTRKAYTPSPRGWEPAANADRSTWRPLRIIRSPYA